MCIASDPKAVEKETIKAHAALNLDAIRKSLPKHVFVKSLTTSLFYMAFDYFMWFGATVALYGLISSDLWETMPFFARAIASVLYWNVAGFFMWCIFVVGHDCGHGTFSDYEWVNNTIGHITHASIMVPFWPWQLSHRRHHMYHNHEVKDYSHPWYTAERYERPDEALAKYFNENPFIRSLFPFVGWFLYLWGLPDGSHFFPFEAHRLWAESPRTEKVKCLFSTFTLLIAAIFVYNICGSFNNVLYYYLAPLSVFGWWIVTVTYLQHHSPTTKVYDDSNFKFVDAAFETIDRTYGYGIDSLSHHITDGHVVHHIFFTKIPHYHLADATSALKDYMTKNGVISMYRHEETYDFMTRVHKYFMSTGYSTTQVSKSIDSKKTE